MKLPLFLPVLALGLLTACEKKTEPAPEPPAKSSSSGNPVTAPVDYLGAVGGAKKSMEGKLGNVGLTQAIQQFQAMEERLPTTLQELVTKGYLRELPKPPYQMKFAYNPQTGEVKVVPAQ
jgi:hypothetical protein